MFPLIILKRIGSGKDGMSGVLVHNIQTSVDRFEHRPFCVSVERDYEDPKYKPIKPGDFLAKRYHSEKYPDTFEIVDLPGASILVGRSKILFHWGNTEEDSMGCVILGEQFEYLNKKFAVLQSKKAFQEFMEITKGLESFNFRISEFIS